MKTYIVYQSDKSIHAMDADSKAFVAVDNIKDLQVDKKDFLITCNQSFVIKNPQIDIASIAKMIYFPGPKNLEKLYQEYTHKSLPDDKVSTKLKAIYAIYRKQQPTIKKMNLDRVILFNASIEPFIAFINKGHINIKKSFVDANKDRSFTKNILRASELEDYMKSKGYKYYDINTGKYMFNHNYLLSLKDNLIDKHVEAEKERSKYLYAKQYAHDQLSINHQSFGAITGRVSTVKPNIQGMNPSIIDGEIYSLDFSGFEIVIYLCTYKKNIYDDFVHSKKKDIYGYIFWLLHPGYYDYDSDLFQENAKETRDKFKDLCLKVIYGSTLEECQFWYGDKINKIYYKVFDFFDVKKIKTGLMDYVTKTGHYLINNRYGMVVADKTSYLLAQNISEAKRNKYLLGVNNDFSDSDNIQVKKSGFYETYAAEKGIVLETLENFRRAEKVVLNYNLQGTGAMIIKLAAKYALMSRIKSKILILRHDEIIVDIVEEEDLEKIMYAMEDACKEVILSIINVKIKKL